MLGLVLLEDVVLHRAAQDLGRDALSLGRGDIEAEEDDGRTVDRHRDRDLVQRNADEKTFHIVERRDRDATDPHFSQRTRVVGVVAHERGEVEGDRQAGLAVRQQVLVALVGFLRRGKARELAHRPKTGPVHRGVWTPCERKLTGEAEIVLGIAAFAIELGVQRPDLGARRSREERVPLGRGVVGTLPLRQTRSQVRELLLLLAHEVR